MKGKKEKEKERNRKKSFSQKGRGGDRTHYSKSEDLRCRPRGYRSLSSLTSSAVCVSENQVVVEELGQSGDVAICALCKAAYIATRAELDTLNLTGKFLYYSFSIHYSQ